MKKFYLFAVASSSLLMSACASPAPTTGGPQNKVQALLGLTLTTKKTITPGSTFTLNNSYALDSDASTAPGENLFSHENSGLQVNRDGLYEIHFYQTGLTKDPRCRGYYQLSSKSGSLRLKTFDFAHKAKGQHTSHDLFFRRIMKLESDEVLSVQVFVEQGYLELETGSWKSSFTIRKL